MTRFDLKIVLGISAMLVATPALAQREVANAPDPYIHGPTGMAFPDKVGGFDRGRVVEYTADGADVSAAYTPRGVSAPATATLYIYPRRASCAEEAAAMFQAAGDHAGAREIDMTGSPSRSGFTGVTQYVARYLLPPGSLGFDHPTLQSDAWLACDDDSPWLIKLRYSYEAEHADEAEPLADRLFEALDFSPVVGAR